MRRPVWSSSATIAGSAGFGSGAALCPVQAASVAASRAEPESVMLAAARTSNASPARTAQRPVSQTRVSRWRSAPGGEVCTGLSWGWGGAMNRSDRCGWT